MRATEVERLDVFRDAERVATLERTPQGCRFQYLTGYQGGPIAFHLPVGAPLERTGDNLPPFFANLLPEGARLLALVGRAQTSMSDMFSLLIEAGPDSVGDVYAIPAGSAATTSKSLATPRNLKTLDFNLLHESALEGTGDAAIPGVQDKVSISDSTIALPLSTSGSVAILKLSPPAYPNLVENEAFFLAVAKDCGFRTPDFRVVTDIRSRTGLLVRRFDRVKTPAGIHRIRQEDGCQLCDAYPADKGRIPMRAICESLEKFSSAGIPEIMEFVKRYAFAYLMGNADLHAKNISVGAAGNLVRQTPMYDIVCTALYPRLLPRMTLQMDGKDDRFKIADFLHFAARFGVRAEPLEKELRRLFDRFEPWIERIATLPFETRDIDRTQNLLASRLATLRS